MMQQIDNVCAHTPAQRRAALIADATVLANATFGREAIVALQGRWHADDECAELQFAVNGKEYFLAHHYEVTPTRHQWLVGHAPTLTDALFVTHRAMTPADAAMHLRSSLAMVRAEIANTALPHMTTVFDAIRVERDRQNAKWGEQDHDPYTWLAVLGEEFGELSQAILHDTFGGKAAGTLRDELVQLVAVGVQWLECLERQAAREEDA